MYGRRVLLVVSAAFVLVGCGLIDVGRRQDLPRPSFPEPDSFPGVAVEDVVADLETLAFRCWYDRGGDIPSSWNCQQGNQQANDWTGVGISSAETGALTSVHIEIYYPQALDAPILDADASATFQVLGSAVIPDADQPPFEAILDRVAANHVLDVGNGWWMVFDRSSVNRRTTIRYHEPSD